MKHIIVPVDFSSESLNGLRLGIIMANRFEVALQMVYVQKPSSDSSKDRLADENKAIEQDFQDIVKEFAPNFHDPDKFGYIIKRGKVYLEIVNQAKAFEGSAIVTSTHGASGFEEFFMGSNSFKIVSSSECPVFTVRHGAVPRDIRVVVLPIDSSLNTRQKVPYTAEIAKAFGAEVHVVGLSSKKATEMESKVAAYVKQTCDYLKDKGVRHTKHRLMGDNYVKSVIEYGQSVKADLISIMTDQSDSLVDFIIGTNAQQMLNRSPIPVLCNSTKDLFISGSYK